ncbi:MAG: 2Fe-2S iron-sulfur cluster-binding protein [Verrucomicrobia bacterium]|nr:2Fe-2S iron-sulfur cluster-binding protein [Verrucomicrobiota bacterium]
MNDMVRIELQPLGKTVTVEKGSPLWDVLFAQGVEFPCGGLGLCRGCRIKVLDGLLPATTDDMRLFSPAEIASGWRLACQAKAEGDLKLELAQWEAAILADHSSVFDFTAREGLGVAVDLGTTTVVAQLLDLQTGHVLGIRMALNEQAAHGADVMSRVDLALEDGGLIKLRNLVRGQIGRMIIELLGTTGDQVARLKDVIIVGNTVMHHLFCGLDLTPLSHSPFEPEDDGLQVFKAADLGWTLLALTRVSFLPCLLTWAGLYPR